MAALRVELAEAALAYINSASLDAPPSHAAEGRVDLKSLVDEVDAWGDKLEEAGATLWEGPRITKPVRVRPGAP